MKFYLSANSTALAFASSDIYVLVDAYSDSVPRSHYWLNLSGTTSSFTNEYQTAHATNYLITDIDRRKTFSYCQSGKPHERDRARRKRIPVRKAFSHLLKVTRQLDQHTQELGRSMRLLFTLFGTHPDCSSWIGFPVALPKPSFTLNTRIGPLCGASLLLPWSGRCLYE